MKVSIGKAAKLAGVHPETLRRWEKAGLIEVERTPTNRRLYDVGQLLKIKPWIEKTERKKIGYARVTSTDQKADLERQVSLFEAFWAGNGWTYEILSDLGSGMNYNKRGLQNLIKHICYGDVGRIVITHKDRLLRFGAELIFTICEHFNVEVVIINRGEQPISFEEELGQDVLEVTTVFSARLYGSRSHKNQTLVESLKEAAESLE
ncbi:MAG: IS607 family transposase [Anaerolineaceae bacterium]|nr:IS607 family transposase [Anaerolineaceae bacterium]